MNPCILQSLLFLASQMYFHVNNHRCTLNYLLFQFDQQDPSSVALALKMNSQKLNGRKIRVKPIETKHKQNARPVTISLKAFVIYNTPSCDYYIFCIQIHHFALRLTNLRNMPIFVSWSDLPTF